MPYNYLTSCLYLILLLLITNNLLSQENNTFLIKPTGDFHVGTTELFLTDSSRKEKLKSFINDYRKLYVKVWYPATVQENIIYNKYFANHDSRTIYNIFKSKKISIKDVDSLKKYDTYSCSNLTILDSNQNYPVLLFNPGFYFGMVDLYTSYMEELASNGYIVFSIIHPYQQPLIIFPDGKKSKLLKKKAQLSYLEWAFVDRIKVEKVINQEMVEKFTKHNLNNLRRFNKVVNLWVEDNQFIIDFLESTNKDTASRFYSKIDLNKIGVFGQSIGGAVAGQLSYKDKRVSAGINIDCFQFGEIVDNDMNTPFMLIESEYQKKWNIGNEYIFSHIKSDFYSLLLLNTTHFITSDAPLMPILSDQQKVSFFGNIDGKKTIKLVNKYILNFFNLYLKNIPSEYLLKEVRNSEIIYKVRDKAQYGQSNYERF